MTSPLYRPCTSLFVLLFGLFAQAQTKPEGSGPGFVKEPDTFYNVFNRGLIYEHQPSNFVLYYRFRVQNRITFEDYDSQAPQPDTIDFAVRRLRMRFEGSAFDPRLMYRFQFAFTRGDMDWDTTNYPNILRDAMVGWRVTDHGTVWFGQGKLPGNRQRVISSGDQEFADRSLLNATFNIDRDLGLQYWQQLGYERPFWIKVALSNGDGRANPNKALAIAYTTRLEWLPFGTFKDNGDYFEGDLSYEETPKLSLGAVYSYNKNTTRLGGQIGRTIFNNDTRNLTTVLADLLLKYRGWALSSEYAFRDTDNPLIVNNSDPSMSQAVYTGEAVNVQLSYNFPNRMAPGLRWTKLWADDSILSVENHRTQYSAVLTKYLQKHRVKVQGDITYEEVRNPLQQNRFNNWVYRLQMELGI